MPKKYLGKRNDEEGILFWSIKVVSLIHLSRHPNTFKLGQIVLIRDQWRKIYLGIRDYVEKFEILIHLSITSFDENITYSSWKHDKKHFWSSFKLFDWPSLIQIQSKIWLKCNSKWMVVSGSKIKQLEQSARMDHKIYLKLFPSLYRQKHLW